MVERLAIAVAGLACETSIFTPSRTLASAFHAKRGREIIEKYPFIRKDASLGKIADWHGALIGHALPGGIVTRASFEELTCEIIDRLRAIVSSTTIHGLWYDIHGAMCVEGIDDSEAELLLRIRQVIGHDVVVSASMDLHGNVSRELVHQNDLITCYCTASHIDMPGKRAGICPELPIKLWIPIPVLLPGEQTSTRIEQAKHIFAAVPGAESKRCVIDAAIWNEAERLSQVFWDAHEDFDHFVGPTGSFDEWIDAAIESKKHPFFISDSGYNPTAGGSRDMTWGLMRLLASSEFEQSSGPAGNLCHDARIEVVLQVGSVFVILTALRKLYHHEDFIDLDLKPREAYIVIVKIGYLEPELHNMAAGWRLPLSPAGVDQD
ncbi:uncharacterized protein Z519_10583 [Cladophialophora bantiana CBS 173.52]|uniref:Microcystin LR degradation protein MlrC N-terminal domain-containing protein n=1 Tax=Cladophialophora bantiana (strain ATCC 10958 / CBS 173.52 / CDC B-1940 / NIH 8579) TaxID=1442370 RepID=A0A0D2H738_CLAB1|nr:uncharacterized protein Z519_10583 [Cladophialophora bantiana CBS 173.52]KIW89098.1 hypothetical protein Z519_10583 [Cladophialophora bantiana CBS 173.52]